MKKLLIALMAIATITGCKTIKKSTESTETTEEAKYERSWQKEIDSLYTALKEKDSVHVMITPATGDTIEVENPCDSLTGLLKDFKQSSGKTNVTAKGNKLLITSACDECESRFERSEKAWASERSSLISKRDSLDHALKVKKIFSGKEVKEPWWIWLPFWVGLAIPVLLYILFKIIW